ncbi:MAG TPA: EexN family lipoprotein [Caulobacteraceae bacterium]|nr:EexN family lipoprotein [Caulobacteraceae bacterium]
MRGRAVLAALVGLAGCSPEPRSTAYFEAHGQEAARVVADCGGGTHRGQECANAQAGIAAVERQARMAAYEKSF